MMTPPIQSDIASTIGFASGQVESPPLDRNKAIAALKSYWDMAKKAKDPIKATHDKVIESYNGILPRKFKQSKAVQTKTHLCWTTRAIKAFAARMNSLLMPSAEDYFTLYDAGKTYSNACSVMTSLLQYFGKASGIETTTRELTMTLGLEGECGIMPVWQDDMNPSQLPTLRDIILNPRDVNVYPVTEPPERAIMMTRTYMTREEIMALASNDPSQSFDANEVSKIPSDKELTTGVNPASSNSSTPSQNIDKQIGMEVIDYYCPIFVFEGATLFNLRATVVNAKYLVRFTSQDQFNPEIKLPAVHAILEKHYEPGVGPVRIGVGLCNSAYDIEMSALTVHNLSLDAMKYSIRPPRWYDPEDRYFNAQQADYKPGAWVPRSSGNPMHGLPWDAETRALPQAQEVLSQLMYQFESAVGIPNFLSGTADTDDRRVSATAKRLEANGADVRIREYAENVNNSALYPLTEMHYEMIRAKVNAEVQKIAPAIQAIHQDPTATIPPEIYQIIKQLPFLNLASQICADFEDWLLTAAEIPPISAVSLDLSTFESAVEKADQVNNVERVLNVLAPLALNSPEMAGVITSELDASGLIRTYLTSVGLASALTPISQAQQKQQQAAQSAQQQQQAQQQQEQAGQQLAMATGQTEIQKMEAEIQELNARVIELQSQAVKNVADANRPDPKPSTPQASKAK